MNADHPCVGLFLKSGVLVDTKKASDRVPIARVFEMYMGWCRRNGLVAYYDSVPAFSRRLLLESPIWRWRKKRVWVDGVQHRVLIGIKEVAR